jgi:hypothetical protein
VPVTASSLRPRKVSAFTAYWLPATPLWAIGSVAAFGTVFVLSCVAGYAAGQTRVIAV